MIIRVYQTERIARVQATKAAKASGTEHEVVPAKGGFTIRPRTTEQRKRGETLSQWKDRTGPRTTFVAPFLKQTAKCLFLKLPDGKISGIDLYYVDRFEIDGDTLKVTLPAWRFEARGYKGLLEEVA